MWKWLPLLVAGALHAAAIRGTVVENLTGHPLARASVVLEPVPGSPGTRMSVRTNRFGFFEFDGEPAGVYLLQASRASFLTAQYGQKRWNSAGAPLTLTESETPFVTIRLLRFGSISGAVLDENDVGQPEFEVAAYRNTRPLQLVAHAAADERGVYHIYGLLPGSYVVRTLGKQLETVGYKPTFAHETEAADQARSVDVEMEQEAGEVNVRPLPGQLYSLAIEADTLEPMDAPVTMTLVSAMGRQVVEAKGHTFSGLPPGDYEIFAQAPSDSPPELQTAYQRISLGRDSQVSLTLRRNRDVTFQFDGLPIQAASGGVRVLARRKDLAGSHDAEVLKLVDGRANLAVGPWEFAAAPPDGYYVSGFSGPDNYRVIANAEGWNEAVIRYGGTVRFTFSSNAGGLNGAVVDAGNPAVGAPVFLEPMDLEPAQRLTGTYSTVTDIHGHYRFDSLAPGHYRVLSSFEYQAPDSQTMVNAGAKELQIDPRTNIARDLDLYVIR